MFGIPNFIYIFVNNIVPSVVIIITLCTLKAPNNPDSQTVIVWVFSYF